MSTRVTHDLKTLPKYFKDLNLLKKNFEFRKNDRNFKVGDILNLREYDDTTLLYTGNWIKAKITYILNNEEFLFLDNYVIISILILSEHRKDVDN